MKTRNLILFFISVTLIFSACNQTKSNDNNELAEESTDPYQLVWSDEFDYEGFPDSAKWIYDTEGNKAGWGNNELQIYTEQELKNAYVKNGKLHITAIHESIDGKDFSSARLNSKEAWKYGKIEVNAKLPDAIGTWPAIWMMPEGWSFKEGNWPFVGEIDIMEHVGYDPGTVHASAHSQDYQWQAGTQKTATISVPDATSDFHSYILEWSEDVMTVSVDDSLYFKYENEAFYLILNVAVGGAWGAVQGIDTAAFPQTMEIEYVRVYSLK